MKRSVLKATAALAACVLLFGCSSSIDSRSRVKTNPQTAGYAVSESPAMPQTDYYSGGMGGDYGSDDMMYYEMSDSSVSVEKSFVSSANPGTGGDLQANSEYEIKIIKNAQLNAETMDFEATTVNLDAYIARFGGYVSNRSVYGSSYYYNHDVYERNLEMTIRIPADKFEEFLSGMDEYVNITYKNEYQEDITEHYYDTDARLNSLRMQEERYLEILSRTTEISDVITIESALESVRYQIESLTGMLARLDNQVAYSFVTFSLREVSKLNIVNSTPKNFGEKLALSFKTSMTRLGYTAENWLFGIIEDGPSALFNLILLLIGVWIIYKLLKKFAPSVLKRVHKKSEIKTVAQTKEVEAEGDKEVTTTLTKETTEEKDK